MSYSGVAILRSLMLFAAFLCCSCHEANHEADQTRVHWIPHPDYPLQARAENKQGTVVVTVLIGADGKVISAKGSGPHWLLVQAAEENARGWLFGPFPAIGEYPIEHKITYVYKLEGKPQFVVIRPIVKTQLPNRIDIVSTPIESDNP
jgi:TonB family protein